MNLEHRLRALLRELEELIACREPPARCTSLAGPTGDYHTMLNLKPGQTGTAIFTFQDNTQTPPVSYPLASAGVLSIDDPTKATIVMVKDGVSDGIVTGTVTPVAGAAPGSYNITCLGHGLADGSDDIMGTLGCAILAPDDNSVVASSTVP